jgi:hypothetical protein
MHARIATFEGDRGLVDRAIEAVRGQIESPWDEVSLPRERG